MEGAQNAVRSFGIRKENEVLIGCTLKSDQRAVEAIAYCVRQIGARVSILMIEEPIVNQPPPRALIQAMRSVDYYLDMGAGPPVHGLDRYISMFDYGVSSIEGLATRPDFLASEVARYPVEILFEIQNRLKWKICRNQVDPSVNVTFRVTDDRGTDLTYRVMVPEDMGSHVGADPLSAGSWADAPRPRVLTRGPFPTTTLVMGDLQYSAEGVLYVDATNYFGECEKPWKFTFHKGYCTQVDGPKEAKMLWDMTLGKYKNANRLREIGIVTHPKIVTNFPKMTPGAKIPLTPIFAGGGLGSFVIALGGNTGVGGVDTAYEHLVSLFASTLSPTLTADGEVIVDRGKLRILEDSSLREFAKKYGDPDYLLSPA